MLAKSPSLTPFFDLNPKTATSYIDPNVLGRMLVGGLTIASTTAVTAKDIANAIDKMNESTLKVQLQALVRTAGDKTSDILSAVSDWLDRSLTMLGEDYKRNLRRISFLVGLIIAIALNVDTLSLVGHLYRDKDARDATVALAVEITDKTDKEAFDKCYALPAEKRKADASCAQINGLIDAVRLRNEDLGKLPIGWGAGFEDTRSAPEMQAWMSRSAGWLLTAFAVSLGAPFWFELLNKLINVRHGMRRPEVKEEKGR